MHTVTCVHMGLLTEEGWEAWEKVRIKGVVRRFADNQSVHPILQPHPREKHQCPVEFYFSFTPIKLSLTLLTRYCAHKSQRDLVKPESDWVGVGGAWASSCPIRLVLLVHGPHFE